MNINNNQFIENVTGTTEEKKIKIKSNSPSNDIRKNGNKIRVLFLGDGMYQFKLLETFYLNNHVF